MNIHLARKSLIVVALACLLIARVASADAPLVSNVRAAQRAGTHRVDVNYDLYDADGGVITVTMTVSTNAGLIYDIHPATISGDVGAGVFTGMHKTIVWDAGADWGGRTSAAMRVRVTADDGAHPVIPSNPEDVASTLEPGEITLIGDSTAFLYTGTNPIQTGVAPGTINAVRAAVLRGQVTDRAGAALSGVVVRVEGHVEYGQTLTRADGRYDLAVNGGSVFNLNFTLSDYLSIQRSVTVPWQEYVNLDTIVMPTADTNITVLSLAGGVASTNVMLTAAGGAVSDGAGTRRARVLLPADVAAHIITYGGQTQQVDTLTTRLTEYTVGANGLNAMPGDLPANVAYTYCVELGAAEAEAKVDGRDVLLSATAYFYVDNFPGMPAGIGVPMAYYDRTAGAWIPSPDGRVIDLKGVNAGGLALVDVDGDGAPDSDADLAVLGFTDAERRSLATEYAPTQSLWRVPITHFSTYDCNYPMRLPEDAVNPDIVNDNNPPVPPPINKPHVHSGQGMVELENQALRESCNLPGVPYSLHYNSRRVPGNFQEAVISIPLSSNSIPASVNRIELFLEVAGRTFHESYTPGTNLAYNFAWDGRDAYGRLGQGAQMLKIRLGYLYDGFYAMPLSWQESFGSASGESIGVQMRELVGLWDFACLPICFTPSMSDGLGGWSLSAHHAYDPFTRRLFYGDGRIRVVQPNNLSYVLYNSAGSPSGSTADGIAATNAALDYPAGLAVAPDGSYYLSEWTGHKVRRVDTNGIITTVAGTGVAGYSGDGGPATAAQLNEPAGLALGKDGSLYIADSENHRVRRVSSSGLITTVAGCGVQGAAGDDGLARSAQLNKPRGLAIAPDGTLFVSEENNHCIRRVSPSGRISAYAGQIGVSGYAEGVCTNALFHSPLGIALGSDGSLYVADRDNLRVRRISADGIVQCFAGMGWMPGSQYSHGDGGLAVNAAIYPCGIYVRNDDVVFVSSGPCVRRIEQNNIISTIAGGKGTYYHLDGWPARAQGLGWVLDIAIKPDGDVLVAHNFDYITRLATAMPGVDCTDVMIASEDATELYHFNAGGRHLATYNPLTGSNLLSFAYNTNGCLAAITDCDGNITAIQRGANDVPAAIVGPDGQSFALGLDGRGYLNRVVDPAGYTNRYTYTTNGLLLEAIGPRDPACIYGAEYDSDTRVVRVTDPGGGHKTLIRTDYSNGWQVVSTTAMGRAHTAEVRNYPIGDCLRANTVPDGGRFQRYEKIDGTITQTLADGTVIIVELTADPRFGMQAPVKKEVITRLPSGLGYTARVVRAVGMASSSPLSLTAMTNTFTVNWRVHTSSYDAASGVITEITPAGRQYQTTLDKAGRILLQNAPGLANRSFQYDNRGRLTNIADNGIFVSREIMGIQYDLAGFFAGFRDAAGRLTELQNNKIGLATQIVYPDARTIRFDYDAHGNAVSITPPGGGVHAFACNLLDLVQSYTPPDVGGSPDAMTFACNADRQLAQVIRPGGLTNSFDYYAGGRLHTMSVEAGNYEWSWHSNGWPSSITSPHGVTVSNEFDGPLPTAIRWVGAVTGSVGFVYDNDFSITAWFVNGGDPITMGYDPDGLLVNAGENLITRNAVGGRIAGTVQGDFTDTWIYNDFAQLIGYDAAYDGSNLLTQACEFDSLGRLTNLYEIFRSEAPVNYSFYYDNADRLREVRTNDTLAEFYQYDANGNRTNRVAAGMTNTALYDARDRMVSGSDFTNYFDPEGCLTGRVAGGLAYSYSREGSFLTGVVLPGNTNIEYITDGAGRRVGGKIDGAFVRGFLYGSFIGPVAELDSNTNLISTFVHGTRVNVPDYMIRTGAVYRIVSDRMGSPRVVVDLATGDVVQELEYDAFGRVIRDTNPGFQPFGFAGGLYDHDTGLLKFGARDYDAGSGRWLARDPVLFYGNSPNLYAYALNQPNNFTDLLGFGIDKGQLITANDIIGLVGAGAGLLPGAPGVISGALSVKGGMDYAAAPSVRNMTAADYIHDFTTVYIAGAAGFFGPKGAALAAGIAMVDVGSKAGFNAWCNAAAMRDSAIQDVLGPRGRQLAPDFGIKYHHQPYVPPSSAPVMFMPAGPAAGYDVAPRVY